MPIVCDLNIASLEDHPRYEALSYTWGDPGITAAITVGGEEFLATKNLFDFLHSLRSPIADRFLWVDAICIDQTSEKEKFHQIGLMAKIYECATGVHIRFGAFVGDWQQEIKGDENHTPMAEMTPEMWKTYEENCLYDLRYFTKQDGFKPLSKAEFQDFERCCLDDIFLQTLAMLDRMADEDGKEHHYTYPLFFLDDERDGDQKYRVNPCWLLVMDCLRWLLTRPWWTRVWTLQEAVLPRVDPTVHASPYSFNLSRLMDGAFALFFHQISPCCELFASVAFTWHRGYSNLIQYSQLLAVKNHRYILQDQKKECVPLENIINSIQEREATEIRDHWFGIFGLLSPHWQEQDKSCTEAWTTTQLFNKCSKLLYGACEDLTRLDLARRLRKSKVPDLPSWAIDLSTQFTEEVVHYENWMLYNAARETVFQRAEEWRELKTPHLTVKAIRLGKVFSPGERIPLEFYEINMRGKAVLDYVERWRKLYHESLDDFNNEDSFWRTVFMDRDCRRHWSHIRKFPLHGNRLTDIQEWFQNWKQTGDARDLDTDRKAGGFTYEFEHYLALALNSTKATFFVMDDGVPGMGPHEVQAGDEVYVIAGCKALAILRREKRDEMDFLTLVGLCFVDGWMYGRAVEGDPIWETLQLS